MNRWIAIKPYTQKGANFHREFQARVNRIPGRAVLIGGTQWFVSRNPVCAGQLDRARFDDKTKPTTLKAWIITCNFQGFQIQRDRRKHPFRGLA